MLYAFQFLFFSSPSTLEIFLAVAMEFFEDFVSWLIDIVAITERVCYELNSELSNFEFEKKRTLSFYFKSIQIAACLSS